MEPERVSPFRANFGEYEKLGKRQKELSKRIEDLNGMMGISRQSGAFQNLQRQMAEVKNLVKEREKVDAEMATYDLARKKDDDYRIASGYEASYSERLETFEQKMKRLERMLENFSKSWTTDT